MLATLSASAQKSIYAGFPESFESPDTSAKAHYKKDMATLKTGEWILDQAILAGVPDRDRVATGKQSIRMNQNRSKDAYLAMNFDLTEGASKVTVAYGAYYKDVASTFKLESSTDGGNTWKQVGNDVVCDSKEVKIAEFAPTVKGTVRFRINKLGLGDSKADPSIKNGRLCIDDITVYKY